MTIIPIHCIHCGHPLPDHVGHQKCGQCNQWNYRNPIPVVALVLRSWEPRCLALHDHAGVLVIRRGIEPCKGQWSFPGGFIDYGESWQQAACRETQEEVGVSLDPQHLTLLDVVTTPSNRMVFFVGNTGRILTSQDAWTSHDLTKDHNDNGEQEILAIDLYHAEDQATQTLCFYSHDTFWKKMEFRP